MVDFNKPRDLDCLFCGQLFATFNTLASHVKRQHASHRDGEITNAIGHSLATGKGSPMLPAAPKDDRRDDASVPSKFNDFLKAKTIGKPGSGVTVIATGNVHVNAQCLFGPQVMVEVALGKKKYDFAVSLKSPNYRILVDRFGRNEKKWRGKIALKVMPPLRKGMSTYIAVQ